jgi:energy-coupling factor transporter transmembrane protein EcfT
MKNKGVFTAIVLITIGVLCLLQLFEIVNFSWWAAIGLWPLILIWFGIKCIPIAEPWKLILKIFVLLFGVCLLFYYSSSHCGTFKHKCWHKHFNNTERCVSKTVDIEMYNVDENCFTTEGDDDNMMCEMAKLDLNATAGKLTFAPGESLFAIEDNDSYQYFTTKVNKKSYGKKTNITASLTPIKNFKFKSKTLKYNILLSDVPVWEMNLGLHATANEIDVSVFKVKELIIESNASALDVKFGNLYKNVDVNIEANASAVKILVPKDMKCIINKDNALSSMSVYGMKKQKDGSYLSEVGIETVGTIFLTVNASVSSIEVKGY